MEPWQTVTIAIINILAILASPVIALFISNKIQNDKDKRNDKLWILKILMMQRVSTQDISYVNALNLIDLIFVDSKSVRDAYAALYSEYAKNEADFSAERISRAKTKLIEMIVNDIGYKDKITWDNIQQPYGPKWLLDEIDKKNQLMNAQIDMANIVTSISKPNKQKELNNEAKINE